MHTHKLDLVNEGEIAGGERSAAGRGEERRGKREGLGEEKKKKKDGCMFVAGKRHLGRSSAPRLIYTAARTVSSRSSICLQRSVSVCVAPPQ